MREDPANKISRINFSCKLQTALTHVIGQMFIQKSLAIVQRFRIGSRPFNQRCLIFGAGLDIDDQGFVCNGFDHRCIVHLAKAATGIIQKMIIAIDGARLVNKGTGISCRLDLRIEVQFLTILEFLERQATLVRVTQHAEEGGQGLKVIHRDVVTDVNRIRQQ